MAHGRCLVIAVGSSMAHVSGRGRLVDYGAALEMRFGATRRGFESRPLRHLRARARTRQCIRCRPALLAHALSEVPARNPELLAAFAWASTPAGGRGDASDRRPIA